MSCVAVKVEEECIYFAADSICTRGDLIVSTPKSLLKLEKINDMIIGCCGYRAETGLMFQYAQNHKPLDNSLNSIRQFFIEFCEWKQKFGEKFITENEYILGYQGKCYVNIYNDITEVKDYCAIGAGMQFAYAALYLKKSAKEAVKVSCALSCFVCEPIVEYTMER